MRRQYSEIWPFYAIGGIFAFSLPIVLTLYSKGKLKFEGPWLGGMVFVVAALLLVVWIFIGGYIRWRLEVRDFRRLAVGMDIRKVMKEAKGTDERSEILDLLDWRIGELKSTRDFFLRHKIRTLGFDESAELDPTDRDLELVEKALDWNEQMLNRAMPYRTPIWKLYFIFGLYTVVVFALVSYGNSLPRGSVLRFLCLSIHLIIPILIVLISNRRKQSIRKEMQPEIDAYFGLKDEKEREFVEGFTYSLYWPV